MPPLTFKIHHRCRDCLARSGTVITPHGAFDTPAFMPVGTRGSIKGLTPSMVARAGAQIVLANTYHLLLRPGPELIAKLGGLHRFMRWEGPILTDSGGYQVFSLADTNHINDDGVTFKSIIDGATVRLTPERSIEIQNQLGADIIMAFDDCPPAFLESPETDSEECAGALSVPSSAPASSPYRSRSDYERRLDESLDRTSRWIERCARAHGRREEQALFGIIQGGTDPERRRRSVERVCGVDLPGYAIGGVAVGEGTEAIRQVVELTAPLLPDARPRYLMGVGYEWDVVSAVRAGVDMFDCVLPTRNGRNANAFTRRGAMRLRNLRFQEDENPIEEGCGCEACCGGFSRAYLRHLFMSNEMLGPILVSLHNIAHFESLMTEVREAIARDDWTMLRDRWPVLQGRRYLR